MVPKFSFLDDKKYSSILIKLLAIAIVSRTFPALDFLYYLVPVILILFILSGYKEALKNRTLKNLLILFGIAGLWFLLTSFWSLYTSVSVDRSIYFLLLAFGGLIAANKYLRHSNGKDLLFLLPANILIILLSVISIVFNIPSDAWTGGDAKGFMGFAGHQNTLGAAILFTVPAVILGLTYYINKSRDSKGSSVNEELENRNFAKKVLSNKTKILLLSALLALNIFFLILTYSRASMLALLAAFIYYIVLTSNTKLILISLSVAITLSLSLLVSSSFSDWAETKVLKGFNTALASRIVLWVPSYRAAEKGDITGLGYGVSDPDIILPRTGSHYEGNRYVREKGNSIFALIEETGIVGLVLFLLPVGYILIKLYSAVAEGLKSNTRKYELNVLDKKYICLLLSFIIAFCIHTQFEAWWVGVGSVFLPLFFLYLGASSVTELANVRID